MGEEDYKAIIATYQQKSFEFFTKNIVLETQVEQLNKKVSLLQSEIEKISQKPKRTNKVEEDFQ
jgi:predicted  nucleic acid-binding Zn-ribbon protein